MEIYSDFSKIMHLIKSDKKLNIEFMDNKTNKLYDTYNSSLNTMDDYMSSAIYGDSAPEPYTGVRSSDTSYNYKTKILSHDPQNKKYDSRTFISVLVNETSPLGNEETSPFFEKSACPFKNKNYNAINETTRPLRNEVTSPFFEKSACPFKNKNYNVMNETTSPLGNEETSPFFEKSYPSKNYNVINETTSPLGNEETSPFFEKSYPSKNYNVMNETTSSSESENIHVHLVEKTTSPLQNNKYSNIQSLVNEETSPFIEEELAYPSQNETKISSYRPQINKNELNSETSPEEMPFNETKISSYRPQTNKNELNSETSPEEIPFNETNTNFPTDVEKSNSFEQSLKNIYDRAKRFLFEIKQEQEGGKKNKQENVDTYSGNITKGIKSDDGSNGSPRYKGNTTTYKGTSTNSNNMYASRYRNRTINPFDVAMSSTYDGYSNIPVRKYSGVNRRNSAQNDSDYYYKDYTINKKTNRKRSNKLSYSGNRQLPPKLLAMITLAKELMSKFGSQFSQLKYKNWVAISKSIWDDAANQTNSKDINVVQTKAQELLKNANQYINKYINK